MDDNEDYYRRQQAWVTFFTNVATAGGQAAALAIVIVIATFWEQVAAWLTGPVVVAATLAVLFVRLRAVLEKANQAADDGWRLPGVRPTLVAIVTTAGVGAGVAIGQWIGGPANIMRGGRSVGMGPVVYMPLAGLFVAAYAGAKLSQRLRR